MRFRKFLKTTLLSLFLLPCSAQESESEEIPRSYVLKPKDQIHVSVYREEGLEKEVSLSLTGEASFDFIGVVNLKGLTLEEARNKIADAYDDGWLVEPEVTLDLIKSAPEIVQVMGAIKNPISIEIEGGKKLDLASAIQKAGGFTSDADPSKITVKRDGQQVSYHYASIFRDKNPLIVPLIDGDSVDIGFDPNAGAVVQVIGQVQTVGQVPYTPNLDVKTAIGSRGGRTENAATGGFSINRNGKTISATLKTKLQPNDVLNIPINPLVGKYVLVGGEVSRSGKVQFNLSGRMSIIEAITAVGGEKETGDLSKISVLRNGRPIAVNLKSINAGGTNMFMLAPGDTITIPARKW